MAIHLITVSALILAVLLVRAAFRKKVPARLIYALWLVVAVKLCMPFSLFAVELPSMAEVSQEVPQTEQTVMQTQDVSSVTKASEATILAPITPITPIVPQQPTVSQPIGTKPSEPIVPTVTEPAVIEPIETEVAVPEAPTVVETTPIDRAHIAKAVWFVGSVVMAVWFAVTGTVFYQRLCADRRLHTTVGRTKVYVSKSAGAPCLAGVIPAIYLTPAAANSPSEHFVITHEYTHLRHGDHIWSALRTAALIVYWWNPLVWAAAMVSKQDAELACDEAVAAKLDDSQRLAYAHTILDTIPQKHAHAVGLGSAPIKERILMLTKRHKNRVVEAVLAVALTLCAVGCSFIGPKETTEPVDDTPDLPSSITTAQQSDPPTVTTYNSIENVPIEQQEPVRVLSNDGNLNIHTVMLPLENEDMRFYDNSSTTHSTRYRMFLEYDSSAGKPYQYRKLYVVDALNGEIADCFDLDIQAGLPQITCTDNGGVIYAPITDPGTGTLSSYYMLTVTERTEEYAKGTFSLQKAEMPADISISVAEFVSPDGKYVATQKEEINGDGGGIYLFRSDHAFQCICENKTAADVASAEVRFYSLTGFADDRHLVYSIYGDLRMEYGIGNGRESIGYGIYNTETGEHTEVHNGKVPLGIYDGTLYLGVYSDMVLLEVWRAGIDGEEELIASRNAADGVFTMPEGSRFLWDHSMWYRCCSAENAAANTTQVEFYSPDLDQKLAEVSCWKTDMILSKTMVERFLICEDSVTFVVPYVVEETAQSTVKVLSNEGNLDIHTVLLPLENADMWYQTFAYDDRYSIYLTRNGQQYLYMLDAKTGEIVYTYALDINAYCFYIAYTDAGCIVYGKHYDTVSCAYAVTEADGAFRVTPTQMTAYPVTEQRFVSPGGTYVAYKTVDDMGADGGIDIRYPDGSVKRILENIMLEETNDLSGVTGYSLIGFVRDTALVYRISGWEGTKGYGIYDVATGEKTEVVARGDSPCAAYGGAFYVEEWGSSMVVYEPKAIWKVTADGVKTKIASKDASDGVYVLSDDKYREFEHSMWCIFDTDNAAGIGYGEGTPENLTVALYSPDLDQKLAEIEYPHNYDAFNNIIAYENAVTVVVPYVAEAQTVTETSTPMETPITDKWEYYSVEDFYEPDAVYSMDLTGDGLAETCTVKILGTGTQCYLEGITITDGQSGETIAVGDPEFYTNNNMVLGAEDAAYTVIVGGMVRRIEKDGLDTPAEHRGEVLGGGDIIDYTVRDGVLTCRVSLACGPSEVCAQLVYTYSYVAGEFAITGVLLQDYTTDTEINFGTFAPTVYLPTDLIKLLDTNVARIRSNTKYGELKLLYSEHGPGMPVYSVENAPGVSVQFYAWDMDTSLTESMIPDEVILDKDYTGALNGLAVGKNIEDCMSLITWEEASYALIDGITYVQTTIGAYTLTAHMVSDQPVQWNLPDESTATDAEWDAWQDAYRQNPTGEIVQLRIKKAVTAPSTENENSIEPSAAEITVDVSNFAASMGELFESTDSSFQHPYTLHITGLPVPVSFDMESEVRPASMHAYGQTVAVDAGVRFYGNCSSELFAYDDCIILTWDYYGIGYTYVIGENFTTVMKPGVNDSAVLRLSDSGQLIYERVNNRMPLIQQTGGAGGVTGYDMFLQSAGPAAIQNGQIILGEPEEYYTVSDKYDLDQVFQKNFAHRLASIEDMFTENRKRYETEESTTITSLADWNQLNYDGQFSDVGNCYALINGLVHFGGGADLSERYPEFQTVTIGEYTISRKKDEKFLYFDFTVTESGLDTLPVGNYKTTVALFAGPQSDDAEMEILECDAKGRLQFVATDRASNRYLSIWFLAELAWDMGDYGTYDTSASDGLPHNYLAHCEGGRYSLAELNALVKDAFGVEIAADSWFAKHYTDDNGDIVLTPGFGGFAFFYDIVDLQIGEDADLITVQHYTDINKLIKSVKVAYRVSNTGRVYGCELIEDAKYAPFGALYACYKYKGWEPMQ